LDIKVILNGKKDIMRVTMPEEIPQIY